MILVLAALVAAAPAPVAITASPNVPAKAAQCPEVVTSEAMICRALEAQRAGDPQRSAEAFEQAAAASPPGDSSTARMWAAAGNMWLAAKQNGKAAAALDKALSSAALTSTQRGEALLDRARVAEAQNDLAGARTRVREAAKLVPDDPFLWYFSAALAIREGDKAQALASIGTALKLAPADPVVLFEAGHVAQFTGDDAKARDYWNRAAAADPKGGIGDAAREAIAMLGAPLTVAPAPPK